MISVLLAEDELLLRELYRAWLERTDEFCVVETCDDGASAVTRYAKIRPDVVVMDLSMPRMDGFEATEAIKSIDCEARVLIVSAYAGAATVAKAVTKGASGFLSRSACLEEVLVALRAVAHGATYLQSSFASQVAAYLAAEARNHTCTLTMRQIQVLRLICQGLTTKQIAGRLSISIKTAQTHRQRLMDRLDIHDVASLLRHAIETGLVNLADLSNEPRLGAHDP